MVIQRNSNREAIQVNSQEEHIPDIIHQLQAAATQVNQLQAVAIQDNIHHSNSVDMRRWVL